MPLLRWLGAGGLSVSRQLALPRTAIAVARLGAPLPCDQILRASSSAVLESYQHTVPPATATQANQWG